MSEEPAHIKFHPETMSVVQSPMSPTELLLKLILTASTGLNAIDVDLIKEKIVKEGIRVYVTNGIEMEMLTAMRIALFRAETERDQNRVRADHYQAELAGAQQKIKELEGELAEKRKTLGFLEQGLGGRTLRV